MTRGFSFLKPAPGSAKLKHRHEARGPKASVLVEEPAVELAERGVAPELDAGAGENVPPEVFTEGAVSWKPQTSTTASADRHKFAHPTM